MQIYAHFPTGNFKLYPFCCCCFWIMNIKIWKEIKIVHFCVKNTNLQRLREPLRKPDFIAENPNLDPVLDFCLKNQTKNPRTLPVYKQDVNSLKCLSQK